MPRIGAHPVVILTINPLLQRLSAFTAVLVTGTAGPRSTHVPLGPEAGLSRYAESYAVATELHNVPLAALRTQRGRLSLESSGRSKRPSALRTASSTSTDDACVTDRSDHLCERSAGPDPQPLARTISTRCEGGHGWWRWRESNPRPSVPNQGFFGRSLL